MRKTIEHLVTIRHEIFEEALNCSMKSDLKHFDNACEDGDVFEFNLSHLENSDDANLKLLVDLIKKVEETVNSLANLNKIDLEEYDV